MYCPAAFRQDDLPSLHAQIQSSGLAIVTSTGAQGLQASHLPLLLEPGEGEFGTLYGHFASANGHWHDLAAGAEALVVFSGADAYVHPGWYPAKAEHGKVVPTWNYIAVHAWGQAEVFDEPERLLELVSRLSDRHEQGRAQPGRSAMRRASTSTPCCAPSSVSPCRSADSKVNGSSARTAQPATRPACVPAWQRPTTRATTNWQRR